MGERRGAALALDEGGSIPDGILPAGRWSIDTSRSVVEVSVTDRVVRRAHATFGDVLGEIDVAGREVSVIVSGSHGLRSSIVYRSTSVGRHRDGWRADGDLTIGGVTAPAAFSLGVAEVDLTAGWGWRSTVLEATGEVRRSDFGIRLGRLLTGDVVQVRAQLVLVDLTEV